MVSCSGNQTAEQCGSALAAALANPQLQTVTICPGTYAGNFTVNRSVTLAGSGQNNDPTSSTILTGSNAGRVIWVTETAGNVAFEKLRITGGDLNQDVGAGVLHEGTSLTMTNCVVSGNQGSDANGVGIYSLSRLQMSDCVVSDNIGTGSNDEALAGGLYLQGPTTLANCQVNGNETTGLGGGIVVAAGTTSLTGQTTVTGNSALAAAGILVASGANLTVAPNSRVSRNTADDLFGGIANQGTVTLQGSSPESIVVNNCPDNCENVPGCTENQIECPN